MNNISHLHTYTEILYFLYLMFCGVYDSEVVSDSVCYIWRDRVLEMEGNETYKSVKMFFDWLDHPGELSERDKDNVTDVTSIGTENKDYLQVSGLHDV